ncbi:putative phage tail protein [Companilactobacillus musae]|uniref:putative phage tail protein n=1 Tax=Companilactobacillus musae TaxID=1903258 RepID=UPI000E6528DE|nr:putative phage tail protein [Companilactobacillus musae]
MVKLQDYLPEYYDDVYEMQKLVAAEQVDFGDFDDLILRTLLNQFVIQADLEGISIFEDQLGIDANPNDSLETRRYNVLMRLLPPKPITLRYFNELLHTLNVPASINVEYAVRNVIATAKRSEISKDQIKRLKYLLNVYLPANLTFSIITTAETETELKIFVGIATNSEIDAVSNPRLKTYADSETEIYTGSVPSQVLVMAKSRALIKENTEAYGKQFIGSVPPQITIELKTYPKELSISV